MSRQGCMYKCNVAAKWTSLAIFTCVHICSSTAAQTDTAGGDGDAGMTSNVIIIIAACVAGFIFCTGVIITIICLCRCRGNSNSQLVSCICFYWSTIIIFTLKVSSTKPPTFVAPSCHGSHREASLSPSFDIAHFHVLSSFYCTLTIHSAHQHIFQRAASPYFVTKWVCLKNGKSAKTHGLHLLLGTSVHFPVRTALKNNL